MADERVRDSAASECVVSEGVVAVCRRVRDQCLCK